jgi:hypothetical protein
MSGIQSIALGWADRSAIAAPHRERLAEAPRPRSGARGRSILVTVPKVRNVGAYRVAGEKPNNQAETSCTDCERDLLVRHDKPEVFNRLEIPSENSSRQEGIVVANAAATPLALRP